MHFITLNLRLIYRLIVQCAFPFMFRVSVLLKPYPVCFSECNFLFPLLYCPRFFRLSIHCDNSRRLLVVLLEGLTGIQVYCKAVRMPEAAKCPNSRLCISCLESLLLVSLGLLGRESLSAVLLVWNKWLGIGSVSLRTPRDQNHSGKFLAGSHLEGGTGWKELGYLLLQSDNVHQKEGVWASRTLQMKAGECHQDHSRQTESEHAHRECWATSCRL